MTIPQMAKRAAGPLVRGRGWTFGISLEPCAHPLQQMLLLSPCRDRLEDSHLSGATELVGRGARGHQALCGSAQV